MSSDCAGEAIIPSRRAHGTSASCPSARRGAARTARRTASATASGSRRRPRGSESKVSTMASCTASCRKPPSRSRSGMPIRSYSGSAASRPSSVSASATETAPAKRKPPAVGDGAGVGRDQQRAVLVDAAGRHLVDDAGVARQPHQVAVAALDDLLDAAALGERACSVRCSASPCTGMRICGLAPRRSAPPARRGADGRRRAPERRGR